MSKYTYVYIRDSESNGACSACVEHFKEDEKTMLRLAFSFSSPNEKHFERAASRNEALKRMENGDFVVVEKKKGRNTYGTVCKYLKDSVYKIDNDEDTPENLLKIKSYKVGKYPSLTSTFWGWLFLFVERI